MEMTEFMLHEIAWMTLTTILSNKARYKRAHMV